MAYEALAGVGVLVVEDDVRQSEWLRLHLESIGCRVVVVGDVGSAISALDDDDDASFRLALVDLYVPEAYGQPFDRIMRGEQLAYEIRRRWRHIKIIGTSENLLHAPITLLTDLFAAFIYKGDLPRGREPIALYETLEAVLTRTSRDAMKTFIVHGHASPIVAELALYLQNGLGLGRPVILRDRPGSGRTLVEKFERDVRDVDLVFVILTPDDTMNRRNPRRSRQNVIFELGFFYGKLQRSSGRVILLKKGAIELPSDIHGLSYISIDHGVEAAGEKIRRELEAIKCLH